MISQDRWLSKSYFEHQLINTWKGQITSYGILDPKYADKCAREQIIYIDCYIGEAHNL